MDMIFCHLVHAGREEEGVEVVLSTPFGRRRRIRKLHFVQKKDGESLKVVEEVCQLKAT
jgi:hypothetical protein